MTVEFTSRPSGAEPAAAEAVLILAPTEKDAAVACAELSRHGIASVRCKSMAELCAKIREGAGAALLTEERLSPEGMRALQEVLAQQEPWSDFPLLILGSTRPLPVRLSAPLHVLGNTTLLDPPLRLRTLVEAVRAALRARLRQYEARRAIEERDRFLAMLGHELRNPLAAITLAIDASERSPAAKERAQRVIVRQVKQLTHLVDDLLDVARVSSGKIELRRERLDLRKVLARCVGGLRGGFEAAGLTVVLTGEAELPVEGDPARLDQVFGNLLTNALKYTPGGGRIYVDAREVDGRARVSIRDDGVGIESGMLQRVFDQFVQVDASIDRSQGGLGIGLTLVRTLVALHGGTVRAISEGMGRGTTFEVELPLAATWVAELEAPEVGQTVAALQCRNVLVVEDNDDLRALLVESLERLGHRVDAACDGEQGLAALLRCPPDAAIVDIGLPKIDGYTLASRVREQLGSAVFLIALTGYGQQQDRAQALKAGFDEHLTKPPQLARLRDLLEQRVR